MRRIMPAVRPGTGPDSASRPALIDETKIGLVNERGGLESVVGTLAAQIVGRQAVKLRIDQRKHLVEGLPIAGAPREQQLGRGARIRGAVGHANTRNEKAGNPSGPAGAGPEPK